MSSSDSAKYLQLLEEARRRAAEMALLNRINRALTSTLDYERVLILILEEINNILGVEAASVALLSPDGSELIFEYAVGFGAEEVKGARIPADSGVLGWVVRHGKPDLVPDTSQDPRFYKALDQKSGFKTRSILCAPLRHGGRIMGAIEALNKLHPPFDQDDLRIMVGVADQAAVALENARLYRELEQRTAELALRHRELVETQDRLVQAERLVALGQMGLALRHEINNPLSAIIGLVDLLLEDNPSLPPPVVQDIQAIGDMADRIRRVVAKVDRPQDRTVTYLGEAQMIDLSDDRTTGE